MYMSNRRDELSGVIKILQEERGIIDVDVLNDKIKRLEEKIMILENNNIYPYFALEERIKAIEDVINRFNFG